METNHRGLKVYVIVAAAILAVGVAVIADARFIKSSITTFKPEQIIKTNQVGFISLVYEEGGKRYY